MSNRTPAIVLGVALLLGGGYAVLGKPPSPPEPEPTRPPPAAKPSASPHGQSPHDQSPHDQLPPGHPPVQGAGAGHGQVRPPSADEPGALAWSAPAGWESRPNPNSMRLATFRIPKTGKDAEDAELTVSRAGGSTEANIQRWVGQFDDAGKDTREVRTVQGMKVTTVEVSGTFMGGMMGGAAAKKTGWSLLGAIVETPGSSYFFKMTGPKDTVKSARDDFHKLLDSLKPKEAAPAASATP